MDQTLKYYDDNAETFAGSTQNVDFTATQDRFLAKIKLGGRILDFGCGAGRDTRYFLGKGYVVEAVDGSAKMCRIASDYAGIPVRQMLFQDLHEQDRYDGIWACSSILHLNRKDLVDVLGKMAVALKEHGYIYTSFKYGEFEGYRNERYFIDFTESTVASLLQEIPGLYLDEQWVSGDVRPGRENEKWLNLFLGKKD